MTSIPMSVFQRAPVAPSRHALRIPFFRPAASSAGDPSTSSPASSEPMTLVADGKRSFVKGGKNRDGRMSTKGAGPILREPREGQEGRPRTKLNELTKGQKVHGLVRTVIPQGLIVNVRAEQDALLHESALPPELPLKDWRRGDRMVAHVLYCSAERRTLKLTLREGGFKEESYRLPLEEVEPDTLYEGTVKKVVQRTDAEGWVRDGGAFVDAGIASKVDLWVPSSEGLKVGQEVVLIIEKAFDVEEARKRRRIEARIATKEEIEASSSDGEEEEDVDVEDDQEGTPAPSSTKAQAQGRKDVRSLYGDGADKIKKKVEEKYAFLDDL